MERLLLALYNAAGLLALAAVSLPALLLPRWRAGLHERLGLDGAPPAPPAGGGCFWIHGSSVGEVMAARGLVQGLRRRHPSRGVVFSTFTVAGRETARRKFDDGVACTLMAVDWDGLPARALARAGPSLFIILETELWPNLLHALKRRGCPTVLVNGRLSERSFPRYRALKWFFRPFLEALTLLCVRTERDGERFRLLGVPGERIVVTGNIKYESFGAVDRPAKVSRWETAARAGRGSRFVAGSLRGGEAGSVLRAFIGLRQRFPELQLVLAPRYPERFDRSLLEKTALAWEAWSEVSPTGPSPRTEVVLVDTVGDLAHLYGLADVAFVGGTLEGGEGHNLLEPAAKGVPVLFGPSFRNFEDEGEALLAAGGGFIVEDGAALEKRVEALLNNGSERRRAGEAARTAASRFGGALTRALEAIDGVIGGGAGR